METLTVLFIKMPYFLWIALPALLLIFLISMSILEFRKYKKTLKSMESYGDWREKLVEFSVNKSRYVGIVVWQEDDKLFINWLNKQGNAIQTIRSVSEVTEFKNEQN